MIHATHPSPTRSKGILRALRREEHKAASPMALSRHARAASARRTHAQRAKSAHQAVMTKGPVLRAAAARKAARTRKQGR